MTSVPSADAAPNSRSDAIRLIAASALSSDDADHLASAGADLVLAYHSSVYRRRGLPSVAGLLPWGSANRQTLSLLPAVVAGVAGRRPVIASVCANDGVATLEAMLDQCQAHGATGVLNAPTVGLQTGEVRRRALEQADLGMDSEMRLVRAAAERGMDAWAYVFGAEWVRAALGSGAAGLIIHLGITGATSSWEPARKLIKECVRTTHGDPRPVLVHGGPLRTPEAAREMFLGLGGPIRSRVRGFMGASVFESRDAVETAEVIGCWRAAFESARGASV